MYLRNSFRQKERDSFFQRCEICLLVYIMIMVSDTTSQTFSVPVVCIGDWFYTLRTFLTAVFYGVNKFLSLVTDITGCVTITQCAYLSTYQNLHLFCLTSSISGCSRKTASSSAIIFIIEYGQCQRKGHNLLAGEGTNSGNIFPSLYNPMFFLLLGDSPRIIPHQFRK